MKNLFLNLYVCVLACVVLLLLKEAEEGVGFSGTGVADSFEAAMWVLRI